MVARGYRLWQDGGIMRPPLQIVVAAQLQLTESQLPGSVRRFVHDQLFIPNSAYIIKERLGKPVYDVPKFSTS